MVSETFGNMIIYESDCHLQQLYPLKTFQRNVFSSVICQRKIWMADAKSYQQQKYCNTSERKKLEKFRNFITFVLPNTEQYRQNANM